MDRGASIGPYCFLRGPAYLGPNARVIEQAAIKDHVSLGHTTKIGGEVEGSVIEPYTNKQHHGFLGHSYLGSWVNLGAGTCNSDLKNTYGTVNMDYQGQKVATGMQFIGAIVGDYAKSAINTSIFTGKTIGPEDVATVLGLVGRDLLLDIGEQRQHRILLAGEVVPEGARRYMGGLGDGVDGDGVVAVAQCEVQGRPAQRGAGLLLLAFTQTGLRHGAD